MAENVTLARPYAEAVFTLARDSGSLAGWDTVLGSLAAVAANADVQDCLSNPRLTSAQLVQLLVEGAGVKLDAQQENLVSVLIENGRAHLLPEIHELFAQLKNAQEGVKDAVVSSAFPIDEAALSRLTADLEAHFKSKLRVTVELDPELIGGVRVAVGDEVIDASVRGKLAAMAAALQN